MALLRRRQRDPEDEWCSPERKERVPAPDNPSRTMVAAGTFQYATEASEVTLPPWHFLLAITKGLREKLTRAELQAVIAHEMSHVRHFDIRLAMLLATLASVRMEP